MSAMPAPTIGRPGDPAAVRSVTLDDVVVTYVVDGVVTTRPQTFSPAHRARSGKACATRPVTC
jgi:hypothetical protein